MNKLLPLTSEKKIRTLKSLTTFFCLCCLPWLVTPTVAQTSNLIRTDLISPSPTAANLGKYGDVPVTYYTGLPNIAIPIFTVTGNELSVPISLTYNYSGMQTFQKPGWVGLGWSLQAGGVITRTIGDKLDDHPVPYNIDSVGRYPATQTYMRRSVDQSIYDNEPDVYNFSFGNYSGKFIIYGGETYLMPYQKLKVTGGEAGFTIVTEDGTRYLFQTIEQTTPRGNPIGYSLHTYTSSWYLTKIVNASGTESIKFTYVPEGNMLQFGMRSQTYYQWDGDIINRPPPEYQYPSPSYTDPPAPVTDLFPTKVNVMRLTEIISDKYTVTFTPETQNRQDITLDIGGSSKALKAITISAHNGSIVKRLDLDYSYIGGVNKFLKLNSITDRGGMIDGRVYKHEFVYNEPTTSSQPPGAIPYGPVDHFGYNTYGAGTTVAYTTNTLITHDLYQFGVNREPFLPGVSYGALTKIVYPTGGSTSFDYELNRYFYGTNFIENWLEASTQATRGDTTTVNQIIRTDTFDIDEPDTVHFFWLRQGKWPPPPPEQQDVRHDNVAEIRIQKLTPFIDEVTGELVGYMPGPIVYSGRTLRNEFNSGFDTLYVNFPAGRYVLNVICDQWENLVFGKVRYKDHTNTPNTGRVGPGMRLKQLIHDNGFGRQTKKKFSYVDEDGFQSGTLIQNPYYEMRPFRKVYHNTQIMGGEVGSYTFTAHTSTLAESGSIGLPFYHKRVIEETIDGSDTLRSIYCYKYYTNYLGVELEKREDFVYKQNSFVKQFVTENQFSDGVIDYEFPVLKIYNSAQHIPELPSDYGFELHPTYYKCMWKHPTLVRKIQYENSQVYVTETKSYYDLSGTRNLIATKQTFSDGTSYYTRYKYAEDYSSIMSALLSANMVGIPIEEQVWKRNPAGDSVMISGKITEYSGMRVSAIYILEVPAGLSTLDCEAKAGGKFTTLISDSRYKKKIKFTYNSAGRVSSQQLMDDVITSYLWDYQSNPQAQSPQQGGTYPVAEIRNAKADSVFYSSFESADGIYMTSVTGFKAKSGAFTIPGNYSGSYKLTYWKKIGTGPWVLIQQNVTNPSGLVIGATGSFVDEVRLCPAKATMTTYTYACGVGLSSVNDANNTVTYYQYDYANRLESIKDRSGNIIKSYKYHVKDQIIAVD